MVKLRPITALIGMIAVGIANPVAAQTSSASNGLGFEWENVFEGVQREQVKPGLYSRIITPYKDWTLVCDVLEGAKRVCFVEASGDKADVKWRIAPAKGRGAMALVILPADADPMTGVSLTFAEITKKITPLICDSAVCVATFPVTAGIVELIAAAPTGQVSFSVRGALTASTVKLQGLPLALRRIGVGGEGQYSGNKAQSPTGLNKSRK